jgi:hypothetical protein
MKEWTLIGIPLTITAATALAAAEASIGIPIPGPHTQLADSHYTPLTVDAATEDRGSTALHTLYRSNLAPIMASWGAHEADFAWLEKRVIYGLFLSDYDVLSRLETQCVILSAIMCQGLEVPSMWHVRGLRRLGVGVEDAEAVCECVKMVARWCGKETAGWVRAEDVSVDEE